MLPAEVSDAAPFRAWSRRGVCSTGAPGKPPPLSCPSPQCYHTVHRSEISHWAFKDAIQSKWNTIITPVSMFYFCEICVTGLTFASCSRIRERLPYAHALSKHIVFMNDSYSINVFPASQDNRFYMCVTRDHNSSYLAYLSFISFHVPHQMCLYQIEDKTELHPCHGAIIFDPDDSSCIN